MSALINNDFRSEAKAYQRVKNHNSKWQRGFQPAPGKRCPHNDDPTVNCANCAARPQHRDVSKRYGLFSKRETLQREKKETGQATTVARWVLRGEVDEALDDPRVHVSDTSSDDDVHDPSAAPVPDAEVMYSFDAMTGPSRGGDVLSQAITQAVRRFENNETEKLVNKEYDVVDELRDGYAADEDDDFEVIDYTHLN